MVRNFVVALAIVSIDSSIAPVVFASSAIAALFGQRFAVEDGLWVYLLAFQLWLF